MIPCQFSEALETKRPWYVTYTNSPSSQNCHWGCSGISNPVLAARRLDSGQMEHGGRQSR